MIIIPTTYIDKSGSTEAIIMNDGEQLTLVVDDTRFTGMFFDDFVMETNDDKPGRFSLNKYNELIDCRLLCSIPLLLLKDGNDVETTLIIDLEVNVPTGDYHTTYATFGLMIEEKQVVTNKVDVFEAGLDLLKGLLPGNYKLKCCYGCSFADYGVAGQQFFGSMLCFRNIKEKYLSVKDKDTYMDIMNNNDRLVQETFLCNDFQVRSKGTGYRG